jgi:hypothetical protein
MRCPKTAAMAAGIIVAVVTAIAAAPARGQNDWQYPDPYFGILEIEKSHDGASWRRYRGEVSPAPRATRPAAPAPAAEPASAAQRPQRSRWKSRWRR